MKRKNVLILLLVFLLLLTPSCVLFVRALETSPFPEREKLSEVEVRFEASGGVKADGAVPKHFSADAREVDLLYAIFESAERVPRRSLPSKNAAYRLTFRGERIDETLKLYVAESDYSLYVLTSGKKLYRLSMPTASHKNDVLRPSAALFSLGGEEIGQRYDYPEYVDGKNGVAENKFSTWRVVGAFDFSEEEVSVNYELYSSNGTHLSSTADPDEIVSRDPDSVLMSVTADLTDDLSVTLYYYIKVLK